MVFLISPLLIINTEADANVGDPVQCIPTPTAYTSAGAETIWVRAVNLEGCVTVRSFELIIDTVPVIQKFLYFKFVMTILLTVLQNLTLNSQTPIIASWAIPT